MSGHRSGPAGDEVVRVLLTGFQEMAADADVLVTDGNVRLDAEAIARAGAQQVRRRRNLTAAAVALGVVALVVGGTIFGRPQGVGAQAADSGPVAVCPSTTVPSPSLAAVPTVEPMSTASVNVFVTPAWLTGAKGLQLADAARRALPGGVTVQDLGDGQQLTFVGRGWTAYTVVEDSAAPASTPGPLGSADVSATAASEVGDPAIASAVVASSAGAGNLTLTVTPGKPAKPTCSNGPIARRIVESDGTVVDLGTPTSYGELFSGTAAVAASTPVRAAPEPRPRVLRATAYRPDGSIIIATLGPAGGGPLPMTADQLAALVSAPGLEVSSVPSSVQSSRALALEHAGRTSAAVTSTAAGSELGPTR